MERMHGFDLVLDGAVRIQPPLAKTVPTGETGGNAGVMALASSSSERRGRLYPAVRARGGVKIAGIAAVRMPRAALFNVVLTAMRQANARNHHVTPVRKNPAG
jgi:hypothetical protein